MLEYMLIIMLILLMILFNESIYFLSFLIMMELIIIIMLFFMILNFYVKWVFLIYMVMAVCESVMGLSLMVSMNFEYGHQKIKMMNLLFNN